MYYYQSCMLSGVFLFCVTTARLHGGRGKGKGGFQNLTVSLFLGYFPAAASQWVKLIHSMYMSRSHKPLTTCFLPSCLTKQFG